MKMPRALPDPSHVSAATRLANPALYPPQASRASASVGAITPLEAIPLPGSGKNQTGLKTPARAKEPNRTEREYWLILKARFPQADIRWEAYTLRLASRCSYTPDLSVLHPDNTLEFWEIKGPFVFSKALTKVRAVAGAFSHKFTLAQKLKTGWKITELPKNPTP